MWAAFEKEVEDLGERRKAEKDLRLLWTSLEMWAAFEKEVEDLGERRLRSSTSVDSP